MLTKEQGTINSCLVFPPPAADENLAKGAESISRRANPFSTLCCLEIVSYIPQPILALRHNLGDYNNVMVITMIINIIIVMADTAVYSRL